MLLHKYHTLTELLQILHLNDTILKNYMRFQFKMKTKEIHLHLFYFKVHLL